MGTSLSLSSSGSGSGSSSRGGDEKILPKYTATVVSRHIRHTALPYHEILTAAQAEKADEVKRLLERHAEVLNNVSQSVSRHFRMTAMWG